MKKNPTTRDISHVIRKFNYQNGTVSLNFNLRIDIKNDLKIFKELLEAALIDVTEEINKQ